jgi:hypothetical protein
MKTEKLATLIHFREELYDSLSLRQDSLFELADAVLTSPQRSTLGRLSLTAAFRRLWPSTCDALADGSIDVTRLRILFTHTLADSAVVDGRPLWVIDGTNWPRPAARSSPERTWEYRPLPGRPQSGIVPAWAYQWLVPYQTRLALGHCRWMCSAADPRRHRRPRSHSSRSLLCGKRNRRVLRVRWSRWIVPMTSRRSRTPQWTPTYWCA